MPVIYPGMPKRSFCLVCQLIVLINTQTTFSDRPRQLIDDIVHYQTQITNSKLQMDKADVTMRPILNKMLADNGLTTFDQLVTKIANSLPADQKQKYLDIRSFCASLFMSKTNSTSIHDPVQQEIWRRKSI